MALRNPGAPRRNPLFAVGDQPVGDRPLGDQRVGDEHVSDPLVGDAQCADRRDEFGPGAEPGPSDRTTGSAVGPLFAALHEAGPEAAEHLVNAAHEVTLAIKVVVDAVERALAEQRTLLDLEALARDDEPAPPAPPAPPEPRVQRIDLDVR